METVWEKFAAVDRKMGAVGHNAISGIVLADDLNAIPVAINLPKSLDIFGSKSNELINSFH